VRAAADYVQGGGDARRQGGAPREECRDGRPWSCRWWRHHVLVDPLATGSGGGGSGDAAPWMVRRLVPIAPALVARAERARAWLSGTRLLSEMEPLLSTRERRARWGCTRASKPHGRATPQAERKHGGRARLIRSRDLVCAQARASTATAASGGCVGRSQHKLFDRHHTCRGERSAHLRSVLRRRIGLSFSLCEDRLRPPPPPPPRSVDGRRRCLAFLPWRFRTIA
jgi:hypothetical protein